MEPSNNNNDDDAVDAAFDNGAAEIVDEEDHGDDEEDDEEVVLDPALIDSIYQIHVVTAWIQQRSVTIFKIWSPIHVQ